MLTFIENIETWQFLVVALIILGISLLVLGEYSFAPCVSAAIAFMAVLDYLGMGPLIQLASFPISFSIFLYFSMKLFSRSPRESDEVTEIHEMVEQSVRITTINTDDKTQGDAMSSKGQIWRVRHIEGNEIVKDASYSCIDVEGIFLLIK